MLLAFTTVASKAAATTLAKGAVKARHAVCAQIDGPVTSHYRWKSRLESAREYRIIFKCLPDQQSQLEAWVLARHPYETPEWLVVPSERVGEKYLSWALANSTHAPS
jgi:periplasmic divalent cation tolerance protein